MLLNICRLYTCLAKIHSMCIRLYIYDHREVSSGLCNSNLITSVSDLAVAADEVRSISTIVSDNKISIIQVAADVDLCLPQKEFGILVMGRSNAASHQLSRLIERQV